MARQARDRFNVTAANMPKKKTNKGYKPLYSRLMEASGRGAVTPGSRRPAATTSVR